MSRQDGLSQKGQPPEARPSTSREKPLAAPCPSSSKAKRSSPKATSSAWMLFSPGLANETTRCLLSHRRDHLSRPIWLRLHLPTRLVGLVARNLWRENTRGQHRRWLAAPQACLGKTVS